MDKKTFAIGVLSISALILFLATLMPRPVQAEFAVKDVRGWQMLSVTSQQGGEVLYVIDPDGRMICLAYDVAQRVMRPVGTGDIGLLFTGSK